MHQKLLGHFAPYWSELFDVIDLKRIDLKHADKEGATWIQKWLEAGGKERPGEDIDPDTADSRFVDKLISRILAAMDLRVDQAKDEALSSLYEVLDKKRFTNRQLQRIQYHTKPGFGDDLRQAVTTTIIISLLDSADSHLHAEWKEFAFQEAMERTLDNITIIHRVKDAQRSKPLPVHKLRFLHKFVLGRCRMVIAATLWQLICDGKVPNIETYHEYAIENHDFEEDMELVFDHCKAQDCDTTGAMQKTWKEQLAGLKTEASWNHYHSGGRW